MRASTRLRVSAPTSAHPLTTLDTVITLTLRSRAMSFKRPTPGFSQWIQAVWIYDFEIIETNRFFSRYFFAARSYQFFRATLPALPQLPHPQQRPMQYQSLLSLLAIEISVARTHGQSVRLPHNWTRHDLHRKVQISHHAPNDRHLRRVLLSKKRHVRFEDVK